jgi:hypothetical protein
MPRKTIAAALTLALCACGDAGSDQQQQQAPRVSIANPISDQLKGGNDLYRAIGLRRPIVDSGHRCKKVDAGGYQQQYKNYAMWSVHCTDSGDWAVFIAPAGEAEARRCTDLAQLKMPACKPAPALAESAAPPPKA